MRRAVALIALIIVFGVGAHDLSLVGSGVRHLRATTDDLTRWALANAARMPRNQAAATLYRQAQERGVTLYAYDQTAGGVRLYTSMEISGTIVAGPVSNLLLGATLSEALRSPLVVRDHRDAQTFAQ